MIAPEIVTVIDIETTGLDPATDHITEIAAIRAEIITDTPGLAYREIGRFQTFVALPPGVEIPPEITELTGIKTEDLRGAPRKTDALVTLHSFAFGTTVVAHNAPFDISFIDPVVDVPKFVCTRALARLVDPDESASLKDVCPRYNIELNGHHRAMNDVEATLQVYAKLREKAETNGISYRNVVIDSDERPLKYVPPGAIVRTIKKTKEAV
ncbi:3'-5' exonuclease [Brevibacillus reuszeri]|uniref:3'-5' exonuclease n=1 Tax=Brevibacillus reuszeri TaxID=54915 RepID=UPI000CCC0D13|nr:3'-5' exonuclease [Brevibacillus reuszeri]